MEKEIKDIQEVKATKTKNLTLTEMKKQSKKLDEQTERTFMVGDTWYHVKIDNVFRKTKQHKLLDDLVAFFDASNRDANILDLATPYTSLLLIKHFTSIEISDDIGEALEVMDVLIDLDLMNDVLNSMPEDQVLEIYNVLNSTIERMTENMKETSAEAERLAETVENKELKEVLKNG